MDAVFLHHVPLNKCWALPCKRADQTGLQHTCSPRSIEHLKILHPNGTAPGGTQLTLPPLASNWMPIVSILEKIDGIITYLDCLTFPLWSLGSWSVTQHPERPDPWPWGRIAPWSALPHCWWGSLPRHGNPPWSGNRHHRYLPGGEGNSLLLNLLASRRCSSNS